jgi:flagellin
MTTSTYKGKDVFVTNADSEYVSLGGRNSEMTFGIGRIAYTEMYNATARTIAGGPNDTAQINLKHLPSDAVAAKKYGATPKTGITDSAVLEAGKSYIVTNVGANASFNTQMTELKDKVSVDGTAFNDTNKLALGSIEAGDHITVTSTSDITLSSGHTYKEVTTDNAFEKGLEYEIVSLNNYTPNTASGDAKSIKDAAEKLNDDGTTSGITGTLTVGYKFKVKSSGVSDKQMAALNSLTQGMTFRRVGATDELTKDIEKIQERVNTARVQAGSQYAALESSVAYTTDLTAQYELGFNMVNDVNFSMETAHLAKNQILQQAATAMLAQANSGQQGLLQLLQ